MSALAQTAHPRAVAADIVLYHLLHPTDPGCDEWTQDYAKALAICAQFVRDYGGVHLHAEAHQAGQYDARCLLRQSSEVAA